MSAAPRTARGTRTRAKILEAAERVFESVGYHEASIVKITDQAGVGLGTFYLYFAGKQEVFDEVVEDLNRRVRHAMTEAARAEDNRIAAERAGFRAFFRFTAEHPALYRSSGRPSSFRRARCACTTGASSKATSRVCGRRSSTGEVRPMNAEVAAWALMGIGELSACAGCCGGDGDRRGCWRRPDGERHLPSARRHLRRHDAVHPRVGPRARERRHR